MKFSLGFLLLVSCMFASFTHANVNREVVNEPVIKAFIDNMVKKHQFNKEELVAMFSQVTILPDVIEKITRPAESLPWHRYRNIFLKQQRIDQGVEFWQQNKEILEKAEKEFGVPAEIIIAILGVETRYGRNTGGYRLLDSLTTLAVDYPKRSSFFQKELEQVLLLAREEKFSPLEITGSYAGAMGKPQFIASSYRHYAIDFDHDGIRDLHQSNADAIGSIANYLKRHGWQRGEQIALQASVTGDAYAKFLKKGLKPKVKFSELDKYAVSVNQALPANTKLALIQLEQENQPEYWVGMENFYAITRYNHSELYAMAVFQLSEQIKLTRLASN